MIDFDKIKERIEGGKLPHGVAAEVRNRSGCSQAALYDLLKRYEGEIDENTFTENERKMLSALVSILDERNRDLKYLRESCANHLN